MGCIIYNLVYPYILGIYWTGNPSGRSGGRTGGGETNLFAAFAWQVETGNGVYVYSTYEREKEEKKEKKLIKEKKEKEKKKKSEGWLASITGAPVTSAFAPKMTETTVATASSHFER